MQDLQEGLRTERAPGRGPQDRAGTWKRASGQTGHLEEGLGVVDARHVELRHVHEPLPDHAPPAGVGYQA